MCHVLATIYIIYATIHICISHIALSSTSNLEMLMIYTLEDMHRLYANIIPFYAKDLRILEFRHLWGSRIQSSVDIEDDRN